MGRILNLIIKGIFVGVANIIPGVSGGTIAVVLRIFDEMIEAVNNFYKDFRKYMGFLIPLFIGAGIGIVIFSKIIEYCLLRFSLPTNMFFVGLVVGSVPLIYGKASERKVKPVYFIATVIAFIIVAAISLMKEPAPADARIVVNMGFTIKMFLGGVVASSAMVIPGISGSFVMVLMGMYNIVVSSISSFIDEIGNAVSMISDGGGFFNAVKTLFTSDSFITLAAVGIGVIVGILLISKIIEILMKKAFSITYFSILGLIFGSIFAIFKDPITYQSGVNVTAVIIAVVTFVVGFFIALLLGKE